MLRKRRNMGTTSLLRICPSMWICQEATHSTTKDGILGSEDFPLDEYTQ